MVGVCSPATPLVFWLRFYQSRNENWVLIQSGVLTPPAGRGVAYDPEAVANGTAYTPYRFDVTGNGGAGIMQFAEIQFDGAFVPEPSSAMLAFLGLIPVFRRRR